MKDLVFGIDEAVHSPEIYDIINTFDDDLGFWREYSQAAKRRVLELCCGTGRVTIPLAQSGIPIVGLDCSERMLDGLRRNAAQKRVSIDARHGDMRFFDFSEKFSLIFVPFNSFQCLYKIPDVESILSAVSRHLEPEGRFILDVFSPSIEIMVDRSRKEKRWEDFFIPERGRVRMRERCDYDAASQVNRVTWTLCFDDGSEQVQKLDMRCFFPQELEVILKSSGFLIEERFGNFDKSPFTSDSPKQIVVCRRA